MTSGVTGTTLARFEVRDLAFAYRRGDDELFGGLSHRFARGAFTAVTGPSGRGKSTLLYLLGLMLTPTRGAVILDGTPVSGQRDAVRSAVRAASFGFVFQDAALDPGRKVVDSVIEPGLYAGHRRRDLYPRALRLMDELGVGARAGHRPGEISGGQAQRVAIARALIVNPPVVLADEPTGNLDHDNTQTVLQALRAATADDRTVIVVTHDERVIEHADEVLAL